MGANAGSAPAAGPGRGEVGSGPRRPASGEPTLPAGSTRRSTTHSTRRPEGAEGPLVHTARGQDQQESGLVAAAGIDATVDPEIGAGRPLVALACTPPVPGIAALAGRPTLRGLRRALDAALGDENRVGVRYQLFDDLPLALTLAGLPLSAAGMHPPPGTVDLEGMADICAGWARGGELLTIGAELGYPPTATGPRAPAADPSGPRSTESSSTEPRPAEPRPAEPRPAVATVPGTELDTAPLGPLAMRRRRRIDVHPAGDGWRVEAFFRDSRTDESGDEWVVHEYTVHAALDHELTFQACEAEVGVLPWRECPGALASATRLVGTPAADLRERVHAEFVGITTCTHLNDTLRALAALPRLVR